MAAPAHLIDNIATRAVSGDREAWSTLLDRHGSMVWTLCRRLGPDPEDTYQEIWEKAWRARARFDPRRGSFGGWLATIAHRHLVDAHRRRTARGPTVELPDLVDPGPGPETTLTRRSEGARLLAALDRLPDAQRRVVWLHHQRGVPLDEIARTEGLAVGTVKSRLHRGRNTLARLLTESR